MRLSLNLKLRINLANSRALFVVASLGFWTISGPQYARAQPAAQVATPAGEGGESSADSSSVPILLQSKTAQMQISVGTDIVGPVTWQLFVRPRENTKRIVDKNYLSYPVRIRFDWAFSRGSLFLQPVFRVFSETSRTDTRDFSENGLGFIQWSRFNANSYGAGLGWAIGSMNEWSPWRPWVALSIEKSDVTGDVWISDSADESGRRYQLHSGLIAAHAIFGISWNPLAKLPALGIEPSVMLPAGSTHTTDHWREEHDLAKSLLYKELDHRAVAGIGLTLAAQVRF